MTGFPEKDSSHCYTETTVSCSPVKAKAARFGKVTLITMALRLLENKHSRKQELTSHVR